MLKVSQTHRSILQQLRLMLDHCWQYGPPSQNSPTKRELDRRNTDTKFLLLHCPIQASNTNSSRASTSIAANPESPATEEAIKAFFAEIYENWIKTIMSPFYQVNMEVKSPVFRSRVAAAGKKFL